LVASSKKAESYEAPGGNERRLGMVKRATEDKNDPFLRVDGVATRFAIEQLRAAEIDPEPLLAKAGISQRRLAAPPKGISAESQLRFLEIAAEALDSSNFGFRLAQQGDVREGGVLYYAMAASQDLGEALRNVARYLKVANESVRMVVCEKADDTVLTVARKVSRQDERHFIEFALTLLLRGCRKVTRRPLRPKAVTFAHAPNTDVAEYERFFECPVLFRTDADTIVVPTVLLLTLIPSSDNYLLRILKEHCESIMAERGKPSGPLRAIVENEIIALLPHDKPQIESVAANLGMGARTLARRLSEEGASYGAVLDGLRRDLSVRYLKDRSISLSQIAWLLGYSEVTSLNHAFKRWTGHSPKRARTA
jgi:AraC-like DNA-binding protein